MKPSQHVYKTIRVPINQSAGYHESFKKHPLASEPQMEELIEAMGEEGWDLYQLSVTAGSAGGGETDPRDFAILVFQREREE
jgi:hypothetical protein